jgi:hypothetical protein
VRRQITAEELAALYQGTGACIWDIQFLEDALHTFLTLKIEIRSVGAVNQQEALQHLAKHRRATLGTSIRTAESHSALPAGAMDSLRELKEDRDWLVHRSLNEHGASLYTDEGRAYVFQRLQGIRERCVSVKGEIVKELEGFCVAAGISLEQVNETATREVSALRGEG